MSQQYLGQPLHNFKILPNYFVNYAAISKEHPLEKATTQPNLGLIGRTYDGHNDAESISKRPWERLADHVRRLNAESPEGVSYKVVYLTRHGIGFHNVQHKKVGTEAWDSHWSHLEGDGTVRWVDAHLVDDGIQQANDLSLLWDSALKNGMPYPDSIYTSPLARCLQTTDYVFKPLATERGLEFRPVVKEYLRERMTDHTCDKRSSKEWITTNFPGYVPEPGFDEDDILWNADYFETAEQHVARKQAVLDDIFDTDPGHFISLTLHSYATTAILDVGNAEKFLVKEGTTLAFLIRGEKIDTPPN